MQVWVAVCKWFRVDWVDERLCEEKVRKYMPVTLMTAKRAIGAGLADSMDEFCD